MGIKEEITKIAVEQGYEGAKPKSIAQAIDALTDTLSGEDVKSGRSVVGAVKALAPYIGTGGGTQRVELFNETATAKVDSRGFNRAHLVYTGDITDDPLVVVFDGTEYELPWAQLPRGGRGYGALGETGPDLSTYPLALVYIDGGWDVYTESAGTYSIAAYAEQQATPTSELGSMQQSMYCADTAPVVGGAFSEAAFKPSVLVGTTPIAQSCECVAAGATVHYFVDNITGFYAVTEQINTNGSTYASVRQLDIVPHMSPIGGIQFTMPALEEDEHLVIIKSIGGADV